MGRHFLSDCIRKSVAAVTTVLAVFVFSTGAHAAIIPASWEHHIDWNPDLRVPPARDYYHDITLDGFRPFQDIVFDYDLSIDLVDDGDNAGEAARIDLLGLVGDRRFFDVSGDEFGGWSLAGALELNTTGRLSVTVSRIWGDFLLANSTIHARGVSFTRVEEPATLLILGLGLLIAAPLLRRRRPNV